VRLNIHMLSYETNKIALFTIFITLGKFHSLGKFKRSTFFCVLFRNEFIFMNLRFKNVLTESIKLFFGAATCNDIKVIEWNVNPALIFLFEMTNILLLCEEFKLCTQLVHKRVATYNIDLDIQLVDLLLALLASLAGLGCRWQKQCSLTVKRRWRLLQ